MHVPTVKIDDGAGGFVTINESDFDPAKGHVRFEMPSRSQSSPAPLVDSSTEPERRGPGRPRKVT